MAEYERKVRDILHKNGCSFIRRGKGGYDIWYSPITDRLFPVDSKIKSRHTTNEIMKQSGVDHRF